VTDLLTSDFSYELPPERIAQTPVEPRDSSRLLVIHRPTGALEHRSFRDIMDYLQPGDLLVANDSRVLPGRLWVRKPTGGRVELLLLRQQDDGWWESLARPASRLREGLQLTVEADASTSPLPLGEGKGEGASASGEHVPPTIQIGPRTPAGSILVRFSGDASGILERYGHMPLPPYIHAPLGDRERYQTVYSRVSGSAAAPTAGLHFTTALLESLAARGVRFAFVTLHVGLDTFRPVQAERILDHEMHSEYVSVPDETARAIGETKAAGRRVVAVGTTAVRSLESWAAQSSSTGWSGWTRLFIYPGYTFKAVDALITNFHLPKSTLLMLVSAFAGRDLIQRAYEEAIAQEYRFFSFGDASLIL
jgi:S-adenosylmethionine:tRNA ribosyltransferase-isomerase